MPLPLSRMSARVRRAGGRAVRRLGLLPGGEPDGLGEDARLGGFVIDQRVAIFFPEPPTNAYQLEQWLAPLQALHERHGVVLLTQDSRTTARLRARTSLPVLCVTRTATLDGLVQRSSLGLVLYASHHPRNFQMLRFPGLAHVYLGHGESDKAVSASNQLKAYDRAFVSGRAAVDRVADELIWFDLDRLVHIGRPQVSVSALAPGRPVPVDGPATVLYAPTWEGAQPSMAYCSVASHGVPLVRALLAEGLRVVYRPHPRTGANRAEMRAADAAVRALFDAPEARATGSAVVPGVPLLRAFAEADALVTDVSSLAVEWLPTGRPVVVTVPVDPAAVVTRSALLDAVPRLRAADVATAGALVRSRLRGDTEAAARAALVEYYLGPTEEGAALARFLEACHAVLEAHGAAVAGRAAAEP